MFAAKGCLLYDTAAFRRPGTFAAPARLLQTSDPGSPNCSRPQEPKRRRVSSLHTPLPAQNFQPTHFQSLPHSLTQARNITPAFPSASGLFLRSSAQERKSTPLFSCACARFFRYRGVGAKAPAPGAKVPGPRRPRPEALRSIWSSFRGKQVKGCFGGKELQWSRVASARQPMLALANQNGCRLYWEPTQQQEDTHGQRNGNL